MTWLSDSIMATRGVAGNQTGATHQLGEAEQGEYHFTMGPYSKPVLHIAPKMPLGAQSGQSKTCPRKNCACHSSIRKTVRS